MINPHERTYQRANRIFCVEDRISIRPICPDDTEGLARYFRELGPANAYQRFHGFRSELSREELRRMTDPGLPAHVGMVASVFGVCGNDDRIVGEGLFVADRASRVAELGFSVADEHQRNGIGGRLLESLAEQAKRAGLVRMDADVLANNHDALRFLARRGFRSTGRPVNGVCRVMLPIESATYEQSWTNDDLIKRIKSRAYELYLARGAEGGQDLDDWLTAEREICGTFTS